MCFPIAALFEQILCRASLKSSSCFCRHPQLSLVRQEPSRRTCLFPPPPCLYTSVTPVRRWRALLCLQLPNAKMFSLFCIYPPIICVFTHNRSRFVCLRSKFVSLSYNLAAKSCSDWFTIGPTFPSSKYHSQHLTNCDTVCTATESETKSSRWMLGRGEGWGRGYHAGSGGNCPSRTQPQQDPGESHVFWPQSPGCQQEWVGELTCQGTAFWDSRLLLQLEGKSHLSLFQPLDQIGEKLGYSFPPQLISSFSLCFASLMASFKLGKVTVLRHDLVHPNHDFPPSPPLLISTYNCLWPTGNHRTPDWKGP